jgi:uncharacterized membrane protein YedE/YeeE
MSTDTTAAERGTDSGASAPDSPKPLGVRTGLFYLLAGGWFGIVLTKSEVISWFRIQEMFRFHSPHMYLIIASAIVVAAISLQIVRRFVPRSVTGEAIHVAPKQWGSGVRYPVGGVIFGAGWALTGACPGPLFALVGSGLTVITVVILSALVGTWTYGHLRPHLPH